MATCLVGCNIKGMCLALNTQNNMSEVIYGQSFVAGLY